MSVMQITKNSFQREVAECGQPVLLDFFAAWCGPCRTLAPILEEIAKERQDVKVCKVNVDEEQELAEAFQVMSIPTLMVLNNGEIAARSLGAKTKAEILAML